VGTDKQNNSTSMINPNDDNALISRHYNSENGKKYGFILVPQGRIRPATARRDAAALY
jgi:hypothetical protein